MRLHASPGGVVSKMATCLALVASVCPEAWAQLAPTGGHYGGQASDTGFGGGATGSGGYGASVPLDFPPVRGGMGVPVSLAYGSRGVGAAGLGWDVALPAIRADRSIRHRRPLEALFFNVSRERARLSVGGASVELVPQDFTDLKFLNAGVTFLGGRDGQQWIARHRFDVDGGRSWLAYDGQGRTYLFTSIWKDSVTRQDADLRPLGMYLLKTVTGPGLDMQLDYDVRALALPGQGSPAGFEVSLASVSYNKHPMSGRFKDQVLLKYELETAEPQSIVAMGDGFLARKKLLTEIDVTGRADGDPEVVRSYKLHYAAEGDADTQQPRLESVTMSGRAGTPEGAKDFPVATYAYGSATTRDGSGADELVYSFAQTVLAPSLPPNTLAESSAAAPVGPPAGAAGVATTFMIVDVTGDGRPDVVFNNRGDDRRLWWSPNLARGLGQGLHFGAGGRMPFLDDPFGSLQESDVTGGGRYNSEVFEPNRTETWHQVIDVNGDGRMDVIDARGAGPGMWRVWLNTPRGAFGTMDEGQPHWEPRVVDIRDQMSALLALGFDDVDGEFLPVARRKSKANIKRRKCFEWLEPLQTWAPYNELLQIYGPLPVEPCTVGAFDSAADMIVGPEQTFVEWELKDINGDGYPDFVYNSSPLVVAHHRHAPTGQPTTRPPLKDGDIEDDLEMPAGAGNDVLVWYNTHGQELGEGNPFFYSLFGNNVVFRADTSCGVEKWEGTGDEAQSEVCGIHDVNGDGLADRVEGRTVYLNSGNALTAVTMTLPGSIATHRNVHRSQCGAIRLIEASYGKNVNNTNNVLSLMSTTCNGQLACDFHASWPLVQTFPPPRPWDLFVSWKCGDFDPTLHTMHVDPPFDPHDGTFAQITCATAPPQTTYRVTNGGALIDVTGDGIPDFISADLDGQTVAIGTGTRFRDPIHVEAPFDVTVGATAESEDCGGHSSSTFQGFWDIDGDGKPDVLRYNNSVGIGAFDVYRLEGADGALGAPQSGRLIEIDNGYGARTLVDYVSAKEDPSANHSVPFAEIVVGSEHTEGQRIGEGDLGVETRYAYGGIKLFYDPTSDAFVPTGYTQTATLQLTNGLEGSATVRSNFGGLHPSLLVDRFGALLLAGRPFVETTISGAVGADPWALLSVDTNSDPRRIAQTFTTWSSRSFVGPTARLGGECFDPIAPYAWDSSRTLMGTFGVPIYDVCAAYGFGFASSTETRRGAAEPNLVTSRVEVNAVDDWGRPTEIVDRNDANNDADDVCTTVTYAGLQSFEPMDASPRALATPGTRTVTDCQGKTLLFESFEYESNQVDTGRLVNALVTGHSVTNYNVDTGAVIANIRAFDAIYDDQANLTTMTTSRPDDAGTLTRTVSVDYDDYRLAPVAAATDATGVTSMGEKLDRDPITGDVLTATDANGTRTGTFYDGLGRPIVATVAPPDGTGGALSCTSYVGFEQGSTGRSIAHKEFVDPVPVDPQDPAAACAAAGRVATTSLDELGREKETRVELGESYQGETLIVGHREYDLLGRVAFEADPYPMSRAAEPTYGTTQFFNADGRPGCFIRAFGRQGRPSDFSQVRTDEASEYYPTCFSHRFAGHHEVAYVQRPDSLLDGSPQAGIKEWTSIDAVGRVLGRGKELALANPLDGNWLSYDSLGHVRRMERLAASGGIDPVTKWHYDSLGNVLELDDGQNVPVFRTYSDWGELLAETWNDTTTSPAIEHRSERRYDALGRLIHQEEKQNGSTDLDTVNDFVYDSLPSTPLDTPADNLVGRLAQASYPTGAVTMSYDGFGRLDRRTFISNDGEDAGRQYVVARVTNGDGSLKELHFQLPDNGNLDEEIDYGHDSAGRLNAVTSVNGAIVENLFQAKRIDPLGRIREAQVGIGMSYAATYADAGRRLLQEVSVTAPPFPTRQTIHGIADPIGRERSRDELVGTVDRKISSTYSSLGRLASSQTTLNGQVKSAAQFRYDPLGNLTMMQDTATAAANDVAFGYPRTSTTPPLPDMDRLCRLDYGRTTPSSTTCNVFYDGAGAVVTQPTRSHGTRRLTYYADGKIRTLSEGGGNNAQFRYDAFGAVSELDVQSLTAGFQRRDRRFGELIERRDVNVGSGGPTIILRKVPGLAGIVATRHGAAGAWIFPFADDHGNRFFTGASGSVEQTVDYRPFGQAASSGSAAPGSALYTHDQWNGGDALEGFGLVHLGARIYDPAIGRFLSRDPLLVPRTGATTNPYAFADNDPVSFSDPTGLETCGDPENPCPPPPDPLGGGGGGSNGGQGSPPWIIAQPSPGQIVSPYPPPDGPSQWDSGILTARWYEWDHENRECGNAVGATACTRIGANIFVYYSPGRYRRVVTYDQTSLYRIERVLVPDTTVVHPDLNTLPPEARDKSWLPTERLRIIPPAEKHWYDDPLNIDGFRRRWFTPTSQTIDVDARSTEKETSRLSNSEHVVPFEGFVPVPRRTPPRPRPLRSIFPIDGEYQWPFRVGDASDVQPWRDYPNVDNVMR